MSRICPVCPAWLLSIRSIGGELGKKLLGVEGRRVEIYVFNVKEFALGMKSNWMAPLLSSADPIHREAFTQACLVYE